MLKRIARLATAPITLAAVIGGIWLVVTNISKDSAPASHIVVDGESFEGSRMLTKLDELEAKNQRKRDELLANIQRFSEAIRERDFDTACAIQDQMRADRQSGAGLACNEETLTRVEPRPPL